MNVSQIRVQPRAAQPTDDPTLEVRGVAEATDAPSTSVAVNVRRTDDDLGGRFDVPILAAVMGSALALCLSLSAPIPLGLAIATFLGCGIHLVVGRPVFVLARRLAQEHQRLRAAMTCPYCRDHLPDDGAMVCDREGCGSFYHEECWAECRATYGGCAIYGCGCGSAHGVGRFALQKRVLRLLIAAAVFPPKLVKRLRESENQSFGEVWRRSRAYQLELSLDTGRTLKMGALNLLVSLALSLGVIFAGKELIDQDPGADLAVGVVVVALVVTVVFPILFVRFPLAGHFTWFLSRAVASVFRAELAALSRADEGTFLARLISGAGKK